MRSLYTIIYKCRCKVHLFLVPLDKGTSLKNTASPGGESRFDLFSIGFAYDEDYFPQKANVLM